MSKHAAVRRVSGGLATVERPARPHPRPELSLWWPVGNAPSPAGAVLARAPGRKGPPATAAELCERSGLPWQVVVYCVWLLASCGLLVGTGPDPDTGAERWIHPGV